MPNSKLKTYTLGCKVNQYETEYLREGLRQVGYRDAGPDERADLCIVNTCTVTAEGDAKGRRVIRRLARQNPDARIVVMGCYATRRPGELAQLPGVTEVVTDKRELPDLLGRFGVVDIPNGISGFANRHRAYVKVQDGCLLRCSYCIIPQVRPKMYSRPVADIVQEVRRLTASGHREIVLTGIHLGHYGVDWNWNKPKSAWIRLSDLLRQIIELDGDFRVRLSSIEATEVTRELIEIMARHPDRICPHLHVCLQSGSDTILRRMNRRWGAKRFMERCRMIQDSLDHPALTTDAIVGFPGETEADFQATCEVVQSCGFAKIHVFPFSARPGTPAAEMPNQITAEAKSHRVRELLRIERELRLSYWHSLQGRKLQVLVEAAKIDESPYSGGTSCRYAPLRFTSTGVTSGHFVDVRAESINDEFILAV